MISRPRSRYGALVVADVEHDRQVSGAGLP